MHVIPLYHAKVKKEKMPEIYMIGGPNGAGKTTSAKSLLPRLLHCHEYVNADAIAAALSPFDPESVSIQSGRLMLERIHPLANFSVRTCGSEKV